MGDNDNSNEGRLHPGLRDRVDIEFRELLRTFDAALKNPAPQNRDELREAADSAMRAGAAILLALGRSSENP